MRIFTITSTVLLSFLFYNVLAQNLVEKLTTSINGTIINLELNPTAMLSSENGKYWCTFDVTAVTDEMRELNNFKFYESDNLIFTLLEIPGSDLSITNSGKIIFYDHSEHFKGKLKLIVYSKTGQFFFEESFKGATQFEFSPSGEMMGVRCSEGIKIFSLGNKNSYLIEKGLQFTIDESDEMVVVAQQGKTLIYKNSLLKNQFETEVVLPRKMVASTEKNIVGIIDKYHLKVFKSTNGELIFKENICGDFSFRDLKIIDDKIVAGIHKKTESESVGYLRIYDLNGIFVEERTGEAKSLTRFEKMNLHKKQSNYDPIPWPFFPFDSMRTVWNHYEQHMGSNPSSSYLHQGLDLITPIGEPTYSVIDGYVKLVLTLGGASYWRIAVSDTQSAGWSDGWLSAHLIESTIQFDVGDTVQVHDYLGDIIEWSGNWGHIHFVNISDSGLVWLYNDNEWGINFSPILVLQPYPDTTAPYIDPVFTWSKFAFAVNETATYLEPDSLFGEIDIIVKVVDYVGDSEWQQPAYTAWYQLKRVSDGQIIKPRTLGHILNHKYPFYSGGNYQPYAGVIYQRDNILLPSSWMDMQRNYYHNLTNSNGDSLIDLSEKMLAFDTDNYPDGDYRIIVEVFDESGNFDIDSMDVKFKNGNPVNSNNEEEKIYSFGLEQNYPNPFNPTTKIKFTIPGVETRHTSSLQTVTLKIYDVLGNEIATLVDEEKPAGIYEIVFEAAGLPSGVYYYQLRAMPIGRQAANFVDTRKMIFLK